MHTSQEIHRELNHNLYNYNNNNTNNATDNIKSGFPNRYQSPISNGALLHDDSVSVSSSQQAHSLSLSHYNDTKAHVRDYNLCLA